MHSMGNDVRSGVASSKGDREADSVKGLIVDKQGINVTRDFSTKVTSLDGQGSETPSLTSHPTEPKWKAESEYASRAL